MPQAGLQGCPSPESIWLRGPIQWPQSCEQYYKTQLKRTAHMQNRNRPCRKRSAPRGFKTSIWEKRVPAVLALTYPGFINPSHWNLRPFNDALHYWFVQIWGRTSQQVFDRLPAPKIRVNRRCVHFDDQRRVHDYHMLMRIPRILTLCCIGGVEVQI